MSVSPQLTRHLHSEFAGEMWEKSPFTLADFVKQRKRWLQGILLVVHDSRLPLRSRIALGKCSRMQMQCNHTMLL
jgi:cellulose synthase/poly-beta-1,6-N-acetylglucosamine synthase-like glycosyltransferase